MNIRSFPLAWRWTDPQYADFPESVLMEIHPLSDNEAKQKHSEAISFCTNGELSQERFTITTFDVSGHDNQLVQNWLLSRQPESNRRVTVSWQQTLAVSVPWSIFVQYWGEFCYPSSDDIVIVDNPSNWVLLYHHSEYFQFGCAHANG